MIRSIPMWYFRSNNPNSIHHTKQTVRAWGPKKEIPKKKPISWICISFRKDGIVWFWEMNETSSIMGLLRLSNQTSKQTYVCIIVMLQQRSGSIVVVYTTSVIVAVGVTSGSGFWGVSTGGSVDIRWVYTGRTQFNVPTHLPIYIIWIHERGYLVDNQICGRRSLVFLLFLCFFLIIYLFGCSYVIHPWEFPSLYNQRRFCAVTHVDILSWDSF